MSNRTSERAPELDRLRLLSDEQLVSALVAGDQRTMEVLFDRYYKMVMRVALRIVRDPGEAQDVVQVVFTDFYRSAKLFDIEKGSLKTWLLQYAYGRAINRKQSLKLRNFYDKNQDAALELAPSDDGARLFNLERAEVRVLAEEVLGILAEKQRNVIELVCFRGLTLAETAKATGESLGNVQHAYFRGLEKLRLFLTTGKRSKVRRGHGDASDEVPLLDAKPARE